MKPFLIKARNWMLGESTSVWAADKGFSPESYGLNLLKARGLLYFQEASTDLGGATLVGNIIATALDKNFSGNDAYYLDDQGNFYTLSGSTFTKRQTVTGDTFALGTSDMVQFLGNTYATGQGRITQLQNSNLTVVDSSWWTGLNANYRHPMEVVENTLYIGDMNAIHTYDGTTSTSSAITLPTDMNITSLRKHPDGRNLIAFCGFTANYSHTLSARGRIYIVDPNIKKWVREIELHAQVEGSRNVGGVIYVTYGNNLGYFNGDGITFMRKMDNLGSTNAGVTIYSHMLSDYEGILLVPDGLYIRLYGNLGLGNTWWCQVINDATGSSNIQNLSYLGQGVIGYATANAKFRKVNLLNAGTQGAFYANPVIFPVRTIIGRFETLIVPVSASAINFNIFQRDEVTDSTNQIYTANPAFAADDFNRFRTETRVECDVFRFSLNPANGTLGYKFLRFMYAPVEE